MAPASFITYQLALIPENAEKIEQANRLLIPGYGEHAEQAEDKPAKKKAAAKKEPEGPSFDDFKAAAIQAKKDNSADFAVQVLLDAGIKKGSLPVMCKAVDEATYTSIMESWEAGPQETTETDEDEWGEDGSTETDEVPTVDAVKAAAKAYSKSVGKDEALAIMAEHGAKALSKIAECSDEQLIALFKELVV